MKEFLTSLLSPLSSFLVAGVFTLTAYLFATKRKKFTLSDKFFFIFWILSVISFIIIGVLLTAFYYFNLSLEGAYLFIVLVWFLFFFQGFFILLYCLSRITFKKWIYWLSGFFSLIFLVYVTFLILNHGEIILKYGEPYLIFPGQSAIIYLIGFLALSLILFYFFIIWRDIKLGLISWRNLSLFYLHYSIIVLGAITFIRIFYFFPYPYIIQIFYLLIPYLVYLSRKEELSQK